MIMKFYLHYLIYKYNLACFIFWKTYKLEKDKNII